MKSLAEIRHLLLEQQVKAGRRIWDNRDRCLRFLCSERTGPESDVDILLDVHEDADLDLFDLVRLQNELSDLLGVRADIALKRNLRKRIGERILQEVVSL